MYSVVLNDSRVIELNALPYETVVNRGGKDIPVLVIPCASGHTLDEIKGIFGTAANTTDMTFLEDGTSVRSETGYITLQKIEMVYDGSNAESFTVYLSQKVEFDAEIRRMKEQLADMGKTVSEVAKTASGAVEVVQEQAETIASVRNGMNEIVQKIEGADPSTLELPDLKTYLIGKSKENLAVYLETHPVTSFCHGNVGKRYSISSEKQTYLTMMISMAQMAETTRTAGLKAFYEENYDQSAEDAMTFEEFVAGVDAGTVSTGNVSFPKYQPSWNAAGEPCTYDWTVSELMELAAEIERVVRPLISKQQTMEVQIKAAKTIAAANAVDITFGN